MPNPCCPKCGTEISWWILTVREREVLKLIALGYSNAEISAQLNIGYKTVETHLYHLLEKLEIKGRVNLALWAIGTGLITTEDIIKRIMSHKFNELE